ncbi:MAG: SUKH-3 domain-containing protein [Bacteroidia bacterium]
MVFKEIVQEQFKLAGWFENRLEQTVFENNFETFYAFPNHVVSFLLSYGNLLISDCKPYESEIKSTLQTHYTYLGKIERIDLPFTDSAYCLGYFYPDHYFVYTDKSGAIYLAGDSYFKINDEFEKGIENLLEDDWSNTLEWNPVLKVWVDEY